MLTCLFFFSQLAAFMVNKVKQSNPQPGGKMRPNAAKGRIVLACPNRLIYQCHWLECVCTYVGVYSGFQCEFSRGVCLSVLASLWVIGIGIRRERQREKQKQTCAPTQGSLVCFYFFVTYSCEAICLPVPPRRHTGNETTILHCTHLNMKSCHSVQVSQVLQ